MARWLGMGQRLRLAAALAAVIAAAPATAASAACTIGPATDQAAPAGIAQMTQSIGVTVGDFNRDGAFDFLLNRAFAAPASEYLNRTGTFAQVNAGTFVQNDRHGCAVADVNHDTLPDIFCAVGASHGTDTKSNELWMQRADGSFTNRAGAYHVVDPYGRSRGAVFFDANKDGWPDLFVANYYPRPDGLPTPNRFYLNIGGTHFESPSGWGLNQQVGGMALSPGCEDAADYDRDGFIDLLVCGKQSIHLYHNNAGTSFTDVTKKLGLSGVWSGAELVDMNGDQLPDLVLVSSDRFQLRLQQWNGGFGQVTVSKAVSGGRALATGDVNCDGLPDLYILRGAQGPYATPNPPDLFYLNQGGGSLVRISIPQTSLGNGASVQTIDANGDGSADFLVTNGARGLEGPVQLITFPHTG